MHKQKGKCSGEHLQFVYVVFCVFIML